MEICAGMLLSWEATSYTEDFGSAFSDFASIIREGRARSFLRVYLAACAQFLRIDWLFEVGRDSRELGTRVGSL